MVRRNNAKRRAVLTVVEDYRTEEGNGIRAEILALFEINGPVIHVAKIGDRGDAFEELFDRVNSIIHSEMDATLYHRTVFRS